jgi:hypothetical protein
VTGAIARIPFWLVSLTTIALASGAWAMADDGVGVAMQPGEWEVTFETLDVSASDLTPALRDALIRPPAVTRSCISPEEAKGPRFDKEGCRTENFTWSGGRVSGTLICAENNPDGAPPAVAWDGEYGPTHLRIDMKMTMQAEALSVTVKSRLTGRRIAECPASEQE